MVARRYLVSGRVQGVGFRWFTERTGLQLGLRGWVRNLEDGRVEVLAVGDEKALEELKGRLYVGPRGSEVRGVEEIEAAPEKLAGFSIR